MTLSKALSYEKIYTTVWICNGKTLSRGVKFPQHHPMWYLLHFVPLFHSIFNFITHAMFAKNKKTRDWFSKPNKEASKRYRKMWLKFSGEPRCQFCIQASLIQSDDNGIEFGWIWKLGKYYSNVYHKFKIKLNNFRIQKTAQI